MIKLALLSILLNYTMTKIVTLVRIIETYNHKYLSVINLSDDARVCVAIDIKQHVNDIESLKYLTFSLTLRKLSGDDRQSFLCNWIIFTNRILSLSCTDDSNLCTQIKTYYSIQKEWKHRKY